MSDDSAGESGPSPKKQLSPMANLGLGLLLMLIGIGGSIVAYAMTERSWVVLIAAGVVGALIFLNGLVGLFAKKD